MRKQSYPVPGSLAQVKDTKTGKWLSCPRRIFFYYTFADQVRISFSNTVRSLGTHLSDSLAVKAEDQGLFITGDHRLPHLIMGLYSLVHLIVDRKSSYIAKR